MTRSASSSISLLFRELPDKKEKITAGNLKFVCNAPKIRMFPVSEIDFAKAIYLDNRRNIIKMELYDAYANQPISLEMREALRERRKAKHLTCEQLASILHVARMTLDKWECGRQKKCTPVNYRRIRNFLRGKYDDQISKMEKNGRKFTQKESEEYQIGQCFHSIWAVLRVKGEETCQGKKILSDLDEILSNMANRLKRR